MSWWAQYLTVGMLTVAVVMGANLVRRRTAQGHDHALDAIRRRVARIDWLEDVLAPLLATVLVVLAWPVFAYFAAHEALKGQRAPGSSDRSTTAGDRESQSAQRNFGVHREDLRERLTIAEVEAREHVLDPLHAVPDLPFGHLHATWQAFLSRMEPGDELWSFTARWESTWRPEKREGYAVVRGGAVGPWMLTTCAALRED